MVFGINGSGYYSLLVDSTDNKTIGTSSEFGAERRIYVCEQIQKRIYSQIE